MLMNDSDYEPIFILKNKKYPFPFQVGILSIMSNDVVKQFWTNHQYQIKSEATEDDIKNFIHYLLTNEMPNLITEGFLSISSEIIKKEKNNLIKLLNDERTQDKESIENEISQNLDRFLLIDCNELFELPIQRLYNIFSKSNLKNHNLAYHQIVSHFKKTNNKNIFILFDFLDLSKLSKESIKDCILKKKERFNMIPNYSISYFEDIENKQNILMEKLNETQENMKKIIFISIGIIFLILSVSLLYYDYLNTKNLKNIISKQQNVIEKQKLRIDDLENQSIHKIQTTEIKIGKRINEIMSENQIILQQFNQKISENNLKCGTKLEIDQRQLKLMNENGTILSSIQIPSEIEKYNFDINNGHILFNNRLIIQWGRHLVPNYYPFFQRPVYFPIHFSSSPFLAIAGLSNKFAPLGTESISDKSFILQYQGENPITWIAIGTV